MGPRNCGSLSDRDLTAQFKCRIALPRFETYRLNVERLSVIEYRSFRNSDPPQISRLWNEAELGQGAAQQLSNDESFDFVNYAQTYFDRDGLIVAAKGSEVVGFAHAGFGCTQEEDQLNHARGVICAVVVQPQFRRQGIGRELVRRAEGYLNASGAQQLVAGPGPTVDPFFFGIYGGANPIGFLESDAAAAPFFEKMGYKPTQQHTMMTRTMKDRDTVNFRLNQVRRKWEMKLLDRPDPSTWWWMTRFGRMEALYCVLIPKGGGIPIGGVTVVGLDSYIRSWDEQSIGLADVWVDEGLRRKGLGQALLVEVIKRLRKETVSRLNANVSSDNAAGLALLKSVGFAEIDHGVVYQK
jgi:ribosomal protein S18 acetylase RimI-like enzyme